MLEIFNTLSRKKEEFKPILSSEVGMYVCGVTVYDLCHIGHGRTFVAFDMVARYLHFLGYNLKYVRNITDIDNKVIKRAIENNESCDQLTKRMLHEMHTDFDSLNILRLDIEPRATEHIPEIIRMIERLLERGHAYVTRIGDVFFAVDTDPNYGILSRQNLRKLQAGARVEISSLKRNPMDFALWKIAMPDEPSWGSPWGSGRPGWHIECSAMSNKQFGANIDIHGGGSDLIFPHHDNEITQSKCSQNGPHVKYWMHTGMMLIDREKMSKSIGNFLTIRKVLEQYDGETVRYFLMSSHYRSQLNYSEKNLQQARAALERLYTTLRNTDPSTDPQKNSSFTKRFIKAMDDDFNTPIAYSTLFDLAREVNRLKLKDMAHANAMAAELRRLAKILGLLEQEPEDFLKKILRADHKRIYRIESLIKKRQDARTSKNWAMADSIRDQLNRLGVVLEDAPQETIWRLR
ncbi:cysteine--tRNA ligase [Candidatus Profftia tarda]|nr:cysteine--tRNA ligase [Candidatus Profftia tarda]